MHILLTDVLCCPRCGPAFGLIVLSDDIQDRQVLRGSLGCSNCRQSYPVEEGVADFSHGAVSGRPASAHGADADRAYRLAALLGVTTANANLLIVETHGSLAAGIAAILPQAHVIGASVELPPGEGSGGFLSRILIDGGLPFRNGTMRGAAFAGTFSAELAREAARVLMPGARLVIDEAPPEAAEQVRAFGYEVQLEQDRVVVAAIPGRG